MRTQFFYTRKEVVGGTPQEPIYEDKRDSFNLRAVIRSLEMADGSVLVLLNDIHERTVESPNINVKNNKMNGVVRKRDVFQSEIYLSKEDGERFYKTACVIAPVEMDLSCLQNSNKDGD